MDGPQQSTSWFATNMNKKHNKLEAYCKMYSVMTKKCFLKKGGKKYPCLLTVVQVYYPATTAARRSHITLVLLKIIVYRVRSALNAPEDSGKHTYKLLPACLLHIVTKPFWPAISKQGGAGILHLYMPSKGCTKKTQKCCVEHGCLIIRCSLYFITTL